MTEYKLAHQIPSCHSYNLQGRVTVFEGGEGCHSLDFAAKVANNKNEKRDSQPFFVMDTGRVAELVDIWSANLPRVQPFYSLKCNADPILLRLLAANPSIGFCYNTAEELQNALEYVPPHRVQCTASCLTRSLLLQADQENVELLGFESDKDLDRILRNYPESKLLLRICVNSDSEDPNARFGAPLDRADELLQLCVSLGLNCVGIVFSVGADCICPSAYEYAIAWSARLFQIGISIGLKMNVLNIGGGFVSLSTEWQHNQFKELCSQINQSLQIHFPSDGFGHGLHLMAIPGRFFAGSVFSLITNIIGKRCTDASYVTNNEFDAGNSAFLYQTNDSYYGTFGCRMVTNCDPHCVPLFENENFGEHVYGSVFGLMGFDEPDTVDVVQSICHFRQLDIGDWLIWTNMGAYTFGNRGSLDDEEDDVFGAGFQPPHVFYFSSRKNWEHVSRRLSTEKGLLYSSDDAEESDGSCGESTGQSDSEMDEGVERGRSGEENDPDSSGETTDEFWPIGWSLELDG